MSSAMNSRASRRVLVIQSVPLEGVNDLKISFS